MSALGLVAYFFFFFNDTATTEIYTLSLHDALPISIGRPRPGRSPPGSLTKKWPRSASMTTSELLGLRSEEHTSELQSQSNLVCRLLLEKKKKHAAHDLDRAHPSDVHETERPALGVR